jgi:hypothetical protein
MLIVVIFLSNLSRNPKPFGSLANEGKQRARDQFLRISITMRLVLRGEVIIHATPRRNQVRTPRKTRGGREKYPSPIDSIVEFEYYNSRRWSQTDFYFQRNG